MYCTILVGDCYSQLLVRILNDTLLEINSRAELKRFPGPRRQEMRCAAACAAGVGTTNWGLMRSQRRSQPGTLRQRCYSLCLMISFCDFEIWSQSAIIFLDHCEMIFYAF